MAKNDKKEAALDEKKVLELNEMNIFLRIPEEAIGLTVIAKILDENGNPIEVQQVLSVKDIFKARKDFLDNVLDGDDFDAQYVLTEKGIASLQDEEEEWK